MAETTATKINHQTMFSPSDCNDNLLGRLAETVRTAWPTGSWEGVPLLVAVSGGADSVALLRLLVHLLGEAQAQRLLTVAHMDHGLRGRDSRQDAQFVADLAADVGLRFVLGNADSQSTATRAPTDEARLRHQRYAFLVRESYRLGARYVVTGHTRDDQVETFLQRLFRGTGPAGMTGIPPFRELCTDLVLVRPLLEIDRQHLRDLLTELRQPWQEDCSNVSTRYDRNWVRHELLPLLEARYPGVRQRLATTVAQQRNVMQHVDQTARRWLQANLLQPSQSNSQTNHQSVEVSLQQTDATDDAVLVAVWQSIWKQFGWPQQAMHQRHWHGLCQSARGKGPATYDLPGAIHVQRSAMVLTLTKPPTKTAPAG